MDFADFAIRRDLIARLVEILTLASADGQHPPKDDRFRPFTPQEIRKLSAKFTTDALHALVNETSSGSCLEGDFGKRGGTPYIKRQRLDKYTRGKKQTPPSLVPVRDILFNYMMPRSLLDGERVRPTCGNKRCCMPWHQTMSV